MTDQCSRFRVLTDTEWEQIEPPLPSNYGRRGHPFGENRRIVEGIIYRYRTGIAWRDLPRQEFGPWQTVWKRHRRYAADGTWDRVLAQVLVRADAAKTIDWAVSEPGFLCAVRRVLGPCTLRGELPKTAQRATNNPSPAAPG